MKFFSKFLLFVLIAVLIVCSGLWIIGGKKLEYSTRLIIEAPPQSVFPYLTKPEHLMQWIDGLSQIDELIPPPEDQLRHTTSYREMRNEDGSPIRFQDQVIRFTQNELLSVQSSSSSQIITSIYQLDAKADQKTDLTYRVKISNIGLGRFIGPLQTADVQRQIEDDARRLKELVEKSKSPQTDNLKDISNPDSPIPDGSSTTFDDNQAKN